MKDPAYINLGNFTSLFEWETKFVITNISSTNYSMSSKELYHAALTEDFNEVLFRSHFIIHTKLP